MIDKKAHYVIINEELSEILDKINGGDHIDSGQCAKSNIQINLSPQPWVNSRISIYSQSV